MIQPYLEKGLDGAVFGFQAETGLHMLRIIVSGAFDEFPKLKFGIGHCGEALPFWLYRIDYMHRAAARANRHPHMRKLKRTPGEYLRENVYVTNSGVAWEPAIMLCHQVMGPDHTLYAMDYPYQFVAEEVTVSDNPADVGGRQEEVFPDQRRETVQDRRVIASIVLMLPGYVIFGLAWAAQTPLAARPAVTRRINLAVAVSHHVPFRGCRGRPWRPLLVPGTCRHPRAGCPRRLRVRIRCGIFRKPRHQPIQVMCTSITAARFSTRTARSARSNAGANSPTLRTVSACAPPAAAAMPGRFAARASAMASMSPG